MTSEYTSDLLVICPESKSDIANHLAAAIGESSEDLTTFDNTAFKDGLGNKYHIVIARVKPVALDKAGNVLVRPSWDADSDIDLVKAGEAQALIQWDFNDLPNKLSCAIDMTMIDAMTSAGLSIIPMEEI